MIDEPVRLVDVAPTVLEIAGVSQPPQWCGVSLTDMDSPRDQFWTLAYLEDPSLVSSAVLRGDRKWIQTPDGVHHRGGSPRRHQLFDLRSDAGEQSSLWRAPLQAEWQQALGAMLEAHPDLRSAGGLQARPSREEVEALKGLGY